MILSRQALPLALFFWLFLLLASPLHAGQFAVSMNRESFSPGEQVEFLLVQLYTDNITPSTNVFPKTIHCTLRAGDKQIPVLATRLQAQSGPKPEQTATATERYGFSLPQDTSGDIVITFLDLPLPRLVIATHQPSNEPAHQLAENNAQNPAVYHELDSLFNLYQPYISNLGGYEPIYFLVGTDPGKSKFQLSFKYRFFNSDSSLARRHPWLNGFHFAYTQTSFWDLNAPSAPFADTSYKPEFFWLSSNYLENSYGFLRGIFLQTGARHESNGKADDISRSTNNLFAKPIFIFYDESNRYGFGLSTKFWTPIINDDETNADLNSYRGNFEIELKAGKADSLVAGALFRWAEEGASWKVDVSYPLHKLLNHSIDIYFFAQYVDMLAESLIDYQERTQQLRFGLAIVR